MYWFTFGNILISLFFIIIAYVIISNQIEPRSKIIIIVFVTILGIMVLMNMTLFKSSNSLVSKTSDAKKTIIIPKDNLLKSSGNYSVSMWIYIEDWNYKFGEKKTILKRENTSKQKSPHIYLDSYKNDIIVDFMVNATGDISSNDNYEKALSWCNENIDPSDNAQCNYDKEKGEYVPYQSGITCKNSTYECLDGTIPNIDNIACTYTDNEHSATLKNIPLQKWFNIIYGFGDNHTDIYLNGKLVQTKTFNGIQYSSNIENGDIHICADGGYAGSISNTNHYNYLVTPEKAFSIYKEGFNNVVVGSLFGKYKTALTFYEDNNERAKYYIT